MIRATLNGQSMEDVVAKKANSDEDQDIGAGHRLWHLFASKLIALLTPNVILNHLDRTSLQTVLRTWMTMWVVMLLSIIPHSDEFMGPSSYLAMFASGIEICGGQGVTMSVIGAIIDLISVVFPLTIFVVVSGINWQLRGRPSYEQLMAELESAGICSLDQGTLCIRKQIYHGRYLSTTTTAVTIMGMIVSFTVCGWFQSKYRLYALPWLLSSLVTIIFGCFMNMSPMFEPWQYGRNALVPMGIAFATRVFFSLVIFPTSSNAKFVQMLTYVTEKLAGVTTEIRATASKPTDVDFGRRFAFISARAQSCQTEIARVELDGIITRFEAVYSRFDRGELGELRSLVRLVMTALSGFHAYFGGLEELRQEIESKPKLNAQPEKLAEDRPQLRILRPNWISSYLMKTYKSSGDFELARRSPSMLLGPRENEGHRSKRGTNENGGDAEDHSDSLTLQDLDEMYTLLATHYEPLIETAGATLSEVTRWLSAANEFRLSALFWFPWRRSCEKTQRTCAERLILQLQAQKNVFDNISTSQDWMQPILREKTSSKVRQLRILTEDSLLGFSMRLFNRRVTELAQRCVLLDHIQPSPRWVLPWSRVRSKEPRFEGEYVFSDAPDVSSSDHRVMSFKPLTRVQVRDPDSTPPRNMLHLVGLEICRLRDFMYSDDVLFNIKRAAICVVAVIPYFCRSTVYTAYREWWLWTGVLTAYTVSRHAVDGVYGLLAKLLYTFLGSLTGMVSWYISSGGHHSGNHYGYAAVMGIVYLYLAFHRHFNTHSTSGTSVVFTTTIVVITGNSWNAGHVSMPGVDLGTGWRPAYIRFLTVTIAITLSFIGTVLPYAYTAKRAIREIIGTCIEHLGSVQASISNFALLRHTKPNIHIMAREDFISTQLRQIISNLASAEAMRKRLDFEPPLGGVYPRYRYKLLIRFVDDIAQLYTLLHYLLDGVRKPDNIPQLLRYIGWTTPYLSVGAYSVMYMSSRALVDAKALPSVTPGHLTERYVHHLRQLPEILSEDAIAGLSTGQDQDTQLILTAIALSMQLYERIDCLMILVKSLVGEIYDVDIHVYDFDTMLENSATNPASPIISEYDS